MKSVILGLSTLSLALLLLALSTPEKDHIEAFFQHLTAEGGKWVAENPAASDTTDFFRFLMHFLPDGKYSVRGTIQAISGSGDTTHIWDIWEFPDPSRQNTTVLVQRSSWAYGIGTSTFSSAEQREGQLELTFYNAAILKHKDTHRFAGRDTLLSESADFDDQLQEWQTPSRLTWVRQE